ncbi:MAG TPA: tannase/feruloyl esterase family alpha/beta hydrolase, partial [Pseudolysinimonas sp.]|nr:tannase/feruloyl esterase family alpha/beta hydrolase [Pseudolysinimonas sp.]
AALPTSWNLSAWQFGGGGLDGSVPDLTAAGYAIPGALSPLAEGAVTYGSDSGHAASDPTSWVLDEEAWMNFAYEQIKKTHDAVFSIVRTFYGQAPTTTYWHGGSQGGREGLEAATRYASDYDGVVSWVPLAYFSTLFWDPGWQGKAQYDLGSGGWIPPAKDTALAGAVLNLCDGLDGLVDGVINDYVDCDQQIDPSVSPHAFDSLRCAGGGDTGNDCLSDLQLQALQAFYGPIHFPYALANGENSYPGWAGGLENKTAFGTDPILPFLGPWMFSLDPPSTSPGYYGGGAGAGLGGAAATERLGQGDPSFSLVGGLDLSALQNRIQEMSAQLDVPADLSSFISRGGKLIMVTDGSDSISNPRAQMTLYDAWVKKDGQSPIDSAVRYYVSPFQGHAPGGATDSSGAVVAGGIDTVTMIQNWVANGTVPPDAPVAAAIAGGFSPPGADTSATKPICRYPAYPGYVRGDPHTASSYACTTPASLAVAQTGGARPVLAASGLDAAPYVAAGGILVLMGTLVVLAGLRRRRRATR